MADSKSDKTEKPSEAELLQKKVDAMMNIKVESEAVADSKDVSEVAADVNETPKSAPVLPSEPEEETPPETVEPPVLPSEEEPEQATATPVESEPQVDPTVDAPETDKAVDDIMANESDTILAVEDARAESRTQPVVSGTSWKDKFKKFFKNKWTWVGVVSLLLVLFALPVTRYKILGLVIKKSVTISVIDSKTSTPVSNAQVELAGVNARTDANGKAKISAGLGKRTLNVSKKYYQSYSSSYFVGFKTPSSQPVKLVATGRQVPITVTNRVTGKPLVGATILAQGTTAKTNSKGQASIALPTKANTYVAKISAKGYNSTDITIQVTDQTVKANSFSLTPAGQIYFLSNLSGKLDVVKSNLDGTGRKTVLAGTGKEDPRNSSLLVSRDWRYLVLKAHREGNLASLYLIDTSNDKVTPFDNSDAESTLVGWYDHNFVYGLTRNNSPAWQTGHQQLKSYDADHLQLNQLDQSQAEGDANSYATQNLFNFYILNGVVAYNTEWVAQGANAASYNLSGKNDTIRAVQPNGQNKKDYQSFAAANTNYIQASLYEPQDVYYAVYDKAGKPSFYYFENLAVKPANIDQSTFDQNYPTFLLSPNGGQTFWGEPRDGKNTLFIGDANAQNKKQVANLSEYSPYGWYGDTYVLVSKNSSELYVTTPGSLNTSYPALKVTDYYKPAQNYAGYGYGYGGL